MDIVETDCLLLSCFLAGVSPIDGSGSRGGFYSTVYWINACVVLCLCLLMFVFTYGTFSFEYDGSILSSAIAILFVRSATKSIIAHCACTFTKVLPMG